jgi:hypothetical protein
VALSAAFANVPVAAAAIADVTSLGLTATYDVEASFGWDDRQVTVQTTAQVINDVRWPASTLAFNLAPLRTGHAQMDTVTVDGSPADYQVGDQTILVPLAADLEPGGTTTVRIDYSARLSASSSVEGDAWEFARIDDVLTAYRWIPWLSRTTPFDRPNVGDPFVTATSPRVHVSITTDRAVLIATSGDRVAEEGLTQTFEAHDVRDFNIAASPSYRTKSVDVAGTTITFYYRTLSPDAVLGPAARAMRDYATKIAPYPHDGLTIAEIGPWSPFESPAHFWMPQNAPPRLIPWMVTHEVAHQWFYSAVGNDQAREPFADEALADFMARSLISHFVPSQCPIGRLDHSIYDIGDCYAWVVYVQGDDWLRTVRDRMGSGQFWSALASYFRDHRGGIARTFDVLAALASRGGIRAADFDRFPRTFAPVVVSMPFGPALH